VHPRFRLPSLQRGCVPQFKLPWRKAGPLNHHDDLVDSDQ